MQAHQSLKFIVIKNPMMPDDRLFLDREYVTGASLHEYVGDLQGSYAISRNGVAIDQNALKEDQPSAGDVIVICPIMHGGNGKNIMRLVAVIALTAFTAGGGAAALGTSLGIEAGSVAMGAFVAAVSIGGTMLINAVLPPSVDDLSSSDTKSPDYTYGIDGAKNTSQDNIPVPLVYGRHRVAGNIIGNYTELQGQTQYLHMLINAGEGVAAGIDHDSILINDQPISSLAEQPEVTFYHGNDGQRIPSGFNRQITPIQVENNSELTDDTVWTNFTTSVGVEVDAVQVNLNTSIVRINNKGNEVSHTVPIELQIRQVGDTEWLPLTTGVRAEDAELGYVFNTIDENGDTYRFDPTGKTVTKKPVGVQYIDSKYPNKYLDNGLYKNHYVKAGELWEAKGDLVTESGADSSLVKYSTYNQKHKEATEHSYYTGAEPTRTSPPTAYEYGELYVDGEMVGYYHDFHAVNKIAKGYNDSGIEGGARSGQVIYLTGDSSSANTRFSFESFPLKQGRYEIRAKRMEPKSDDTQIRDDVIWNEVNEIQEVGLAYNYSALLGLKIKVTDQISNIPKITFEHLGQVIRVWDEDAKAWVPSANSAAIADGFFVTDRERTIFGEVELFNDEEKQTSLKLASGNSVPCAPAFDKPAHMLAVEDASLYVDGFYQHANPAWVVWDIMTSTRYGAGISPARLDFYAFKAWAKFCEEKNLTYRGVISSKANVWDCISQIFRVGRATPLRMGTRYSVSVEKVKSPVMRFGQDNIVKDSFSTDWLPVDDRANEIELTFFDEKNDYAERTIKVSNSALIQAGASPNTSSSKMRGIVTEEQATREAIYSLNMNKLVQTVTFDAPIEALACTIGDVVTVQHNMMEWGAAGKLEAVTPLGSDQYQLRLDQEVTFISGEEWKMILSLDIVSRGSYVVDSVYGNYITLRDFDANAAERIKRATMNTRDMAVLDLFSSSNGENGIVVSDAIGITIGDTVTLHDLDVVSNVSLTPAQYDSPTNLVTITLPEATPEALQGFVVGYENYESRLFSIRSIGLSSDSLTRSITALEYNEEALRDDTMDFVITDVPANRPLDPISNLQITETDVLDTASQKVRVVLSWTHDDSRYRVASVSARVSGEGIKYLGESQFSAELICELNKAVEFIIVPRDAANNPGVTTTIQHVPAGSDGNPYTVSDAAIESIVGGAKLSWDMTSSNLYATEIYAIKQGTPVDGTVVELTNPDTWDGDKILSNASLISTTLTTSYDHITETGSVIAQTHYYWLRTIDRSGLFSSFVYAGNSSPSTSRAFNTVTVYQWSIDAPAQPTGGSYENPQPDQAEWKTAPGDLSSEAPSNIKLWSSVRTFCNMETYQDEAWSLPSANSVDAEYQYTWVAYAEDPFGAGFSLTRQDTTRFIGYAYNKSDPMPSTDHLDYEWSLLLIDDQSIVDVATETVNSITAGIVDEITADVVTDVTEAVASNIASDIEAAVDEASDEIRVEQQAAHDLMAEAGLASILDTIIERDVTRNETFGPNGTYAKFEQTEQIISEVEQSVVEVNELLTAALQTAEANLQAQIDTNKTAIADTDSAMATLDTTLRAMIDDGDNALLAKVNTNTQAITDANGSIAALDTTLRAVIDSVEGELSALITSNSTAIANTDSTVANLETTLRAEMDLAEINLQSQINTNTTAITNTNTAIATLETDLRSEMETADSALQSQVNANATAISTTNSTVAALETALRSEMELADSDLQSQVNTNATAIANTNSTIASLETTLRSEMDAADENLQSQVNTNASSIANTNTAMAKLETDLRAEMTAADSNLQSQVNTNSAAITNTNTAMASLETELRAEIDTAESNLQAQINSNSTAITDANNSIASVQSSLTAALNTVESDLQAQIDSNVTAIANANLSIASVEDTLTASLNTVESDLQAQITSNATAVANTNASVSALETSLTASLDTATSDLQSQIDINSTAITNANSSIAQVESDLTASLNTTKNNLQSQINSNATAITSANSSIASVEDTLTASLDSVESALQAQITTNANAITSTNSSVANITNKLNSSAGSSYASIQEAMQAAVDADDTYQAQWGIKTSVNGLQGGVGFYNNGSTTQFLVNADTFAVTNKASDGTTNVVKSVFTVTGGKAYIDKAFINTLESVSISSSTLSSSIINTSTLNAPTINAGNIEAQTLTFVSSSSIPSDIKNSNAISTANSYADTQSNAARAGAITDAISDPRLSNDALAAPSTGLFSNPRFLLSASDGRPLGAYACYGSTSKATVQRMADTTHPDALVINLSGDPTSGAALTAFPVNPNQKYRIRLRWRSGSGNTTGTYFRIAELDSNLPATAKFISGNTTFEEGGVVGTRQLTGFWENKGLSNNWVDNEFTYTPTSSAKWASLMFLNWDGNTGTLRIAECTITPITGALANKDSLTASEVGAETPSGAQSKANTAQSNAESYALSKANTAQSNAESYADTKASQAQANAQAYTEGRIYPNQTSIQIKSANYSAGSAGWAIDSAGTAEFRQVTIRGTVYGDSGWFNGTVYAKHISGDIVSMVKKTSNAVSSSNDQAVVSFGTININTAEPFDRTLVVSLQLNCTAGNVIGSAGTQTTKAYIRLSGTYGTKLSNDAESYKRNSDYVVVEEYEGDKICTVAITIGANTTGSVTVSLYQTGTGSCSMRAITGDSEWFPQLFKNGSHLS